MASEQVTGAAALNEDDEELPMKNVTEPLDTDVLCGRGGAALRHPGNKTYRTLVQLNKGLYITCIKSEKLKISKSIVAAIREQNGRFLEKNQHGSWDDIGEKKAVEKTSQALREGQPKLKRQIAELGGSAAAAMAQNQGYSAPPPPSQPRHSYSSSDGNLAVAAAAAFAANEYSKYEPQQEQPQPPPLDEAMATAFRNHRFLSDNLHNSTLSAEEMPPPPNHQMHDMLLQQLSISNRNCQEEPSGVNRMRPSMLQRGSLIAHELGIDPQSVSSRSLLSEFSNYGMADSVLSMDTGSKRSLVGLDLSHSNAAAAAAASDQQQGESSPTTTPIGDRRRFFARMKQRSSTSGRTNISQQQQQRNMMMASGKNMDGTTSARSFNDGMPDFYLVDSQMSLYSNMSSIGEPDAPLESRRSIMSGLSKIDDVEDCGGSIFSDLSRKIGNVSTRSIAMSEISTMDDVDSVEYPDHKPAASSSPPQPMTSNSMEFE